MDSPIKSISESTSKICICPPMRWQAIMLDYINQINTLEATATTIPTVKWSATTEISWLTSSPNRQQVILTMDQHHQITSTSSRVLKVYRHVCRLIQWMEERWWWLAHPESRVSVFWRVVEFRQHLGKLRIISTRQRWLSNLNCHQWICHSRIMKCRIRSFVIRCQIQPIHIRTP